jgi:hypothetical protein
MRLTFVETPEFHRSAKGQLTDEQIRAVQDELLENPEGGDLVSGTKFRKIRISLAGRGKRGGGRVVYYYAARTAKIYLLFCYAKSDTSDLSPAGKKHLQKVADLLDRETK